MRFSIIVATLLASIVTAMPDPLPLGYNGPCSRDNCGASGTNCGNRICVGWPSTEIEKRKGCTCTTG
ncbi:hypothetical protein HBI56_207930 [Parastagonospora nodorum]|uniref:Uncharacterized protein n=2 Tax=Phaeosphaeria nodorum (strain SN15 / ATCC MYA-4574 / FGSC 10173) TaxID=321614 RepID=A0A7U2I921_PHANO|nr:hypothetical protein SNOG_15422 [Parastagonospora nodorum SN15]KAH3905396.1 hypothetical protein HBH56_217110 [Parastagonospora nodorum]EAT77087.2 hypothetical protein SNOG_15422 [Parastagonospora nodorum SN15]KAH3922764.1 hypothetical protein HBH54_218970 [Parastagonospora nodorum]KAH3941198.1 hypothetical protein HBH53_206610 [Parastagonospora nodorum]KAH3956345.1 hypothetical protein HBH51_244270 [Parastagonospora nodorum]